jgi:hypothetical protein
MTDLRDLAIAAHGGLDRWNQLSSVTAHLLVGGALWALKGQDGVLEDSTVRVDLHRQFASHTPFGGPELRDAYTPDRVAIETLAGEVLEERANPRDSFAGHTLETPWDRLHLAYFSGYAMWTYLTQPFSWAEPGVEVAELGPWQENGDSGRTLKVTFPESIATHSRENIYYLDDRGLIRRQDYTVEVIGATGPSAHYTSEHREFGGIVVPTKRRVHLIGPDGAVMREPLIVSIDLDDVRFQ